MVRENLPPGIGYFPGFLCANAQSELADSIIRVLEEAPFFRPTMPKTGRQFSVQMTNCGQLGWVSDKSGGYRYQDHHPITGRPWPAIPDLALSVWRSVARTSCEPEACLINFYDGHAKLGGHVDKDERDLSHPVVSISLGDDGVYHVGGTKRSDPRTRIDLKSGDVIVLAGVSRLAYHGLDRIQPGSSDLLSSGGRINLTLRRVNAAA